MKKDTYYFSHDATAKDDPKCMLLIDQLGLEGYGIFWILVETLRAQPDYKCPLNIIPLLAKRFNTSKEKMEAVINGFELFKIENGLVFFSETLIRRMTTVDDKRKRLSEWGKKGYEAKINKIQALSSHPQAMLEPPLSNKTKLDKIKSDETREELYINSESELLNSEIWHQSVAMACSLKNTDEVKSWLEKFILEIKAKDNIAGRGLRELKSHAVSWIKTEQSKKKNNYYSDDWKNELSKTPPPIPEHLKEKVIALQKKLETQKK